MNSKRFKTVFCIVTALLCIATALSLIFSVFISSSDMSETAKTVLNFFNFLLPSTGILIMTVYIFLKAKRIGSAK